MSLNSVRIFFACIVFTLITSLISAHGIEDQVNDPESNVSYDCGTGFGPGPDEGIYLYQGFVPAVSNLTAVSLRLRVAGTLPETGAPTSIRIRAGSPTGSILGQASTSVAAPDGDAQVLVHFHFASALSLTPGNLYVIEWFALMEDAQDWHLSWTGTTDVDSYAAASSWGCTLIELTSRDLNFITYAGNTAPIARDDNALTAFNTPVTIAVTANDSDIDADLVPSSVTVIAGSVNGSATPNGDGTVTYSPNAGFSGIDSFTYQVCDAVSLCDIALVTIVVASGGAEEPSAPSDAGPPADAGPSADAGDRAGENANSNACADNPGRASDHRPDDIPPCR